MIARDEKPIEVISYCGTDGKIKPLRFRFEDENGFWQTAPVLDIVDIREEQHVHAERFRYLCKTEVNLLPHLMEVHYLIRDHVWTLRGKIY